MITSAISEKWLKLRKLKTLISHKLHGFDLPKMQSALLYQVTEIPRKKHSLLMFTMKTLGFLGEFHRIPEQYKDQCHTSELCKGVNRAIVNSLDYGFKLLGAFWFRLEQIRHLLAYHVHMQVKALPQAMSGKT
jgi:hypothetical protein